MRQVIHPPHFDAVLALHSGGTLRTGTVLLSWREKKILRNHLAWIMSGSLTGARKSSIGGSLSTSNATSDSSVFNELESRSWMLLLSKITYYG